MDDWQEAAFSQRHVHNRLHVKGGRGKHSEFDVQRTLGTFEVECAAARKLRPGAGSGTDAKLEIYCLDTAGTALYAELDFPQVLHAVVLLTASRKTMNATVKALVEDTNGRQEQTGTNNGNEERSDHDNEEGDGEDEEAEEQKESIQRRADEDDSSSDEYTADAGDRDSIRADRIRRFEKNSFRVPKFWMKWQGQRLTRPESTDVNVGTESTSRPICGDGYLIFNGNVCGKFQGTLSCEELEWKNVKLKGQAIRKQPPRDFNMEWQSFEQG